jgi:outer membrane protein TolC
MQPAFELGASPSHIHQTIPQKGDMKKLLAVALLLGGASGVARAQTFTLAEALKIGLENRLELKSQALQVQLAQTENQKVVAKWLPQVSASADLRWNTQLQTTILPFDLSGNNPGGTTAARFGLPFNNTVGVQLDQKVLDANQGLDRKINNVQAENQANSLEQQKINAKLAIAEAYYLAVFNQERQRLAEQQVARNQANLERGQTQFASGTLLANDLARLQLDVANAKVARQKAQQDHDLALDALRYQMNAPEQPVGSLEALAGILQQSEAEASTQGARPELKAEELARQLNELNQKKQRARNLPTLAAYGSYSVLQLAEQFNPFAQGTWFPFSYVGLKLNVPIFDGRQARLAGRDYGVRQQANRHNLAKLQADVDHETKTARKQLDQARLDLADTQQNLALAQQVLATDRLRYEKGTLTLADLKNTEYSLQSAENNYLTSIYNLLVARVRWQKASGGL